MENSNKYNEEQLRKEAPTLFGIKKETPEVPKGYFENLPGSIMEKIKEKSEKKSWWKRTFLWDFSRHSFMGNAVRVLGLAIVFFFVFDNESEKPEIIAQNTDEIELNIDGIELEYLADVEFEEADIIEYYSEDNEIALPVMEICECDVDDMIDYIYDTEIETDLLIKILEKDENITI